jgi:hypothetical protein
VRRPMTTSHSPVATRIMERVEQSGDIMKLGQVMPWPQD